MPPKKRTKIGYRKKYALMPSRAAGSLKEKQPEDDSDTYFTKFLVDYEDEHSNSINLLESTEYVDSDGYEANEFFVILDKAYRYNPEDDLDLYAAHLQSTVYSKLRTQCELVLDSEFCYIPTTKEIKFVSLYDSDNVSEAPRVKICIGIGKNFDVKIQVHGQSLDQSHSIWTDIVRNCYTVDQVKDILQELHQYSVCCGNRDADLQNLMPFETFISGANSGKSQAYREYMYIGSTVRSKSCCLLVKQRSQRCSNCKTYRKTLIKVKSRQAHTVKISTPKKDWLKSRVPNKHLTNNQKTHKLKQLKSLSVSLQQENAKLKKKIQQQIKGQGVVFDQDLNKDFSVMMESSCEDIKKNFPDENSYQRLFWEEQMKYAKLKDKRGMRWHPMVIKWCIYLKSKSSSTYDTLKNSGFIKLPSERTLHDYTAIVTKGTGFHSDVIEHLINEVSEFEGHQRIVGILQDEIRIRSDLVYDKNTGQLIGFVDLGNITNDLLRLESKENEDSLPLAKYVLVLMVRGVSSNLKYPLAYFATNGITSDQLFCILWEAVEILEIDTGLEVMFITSDGASPNRRFIRLHAEGNDTVVYKAKNIFAPEDRFIYFVSDAPHLIKTARNCFSNSYAHKNTRKMWKDGHDISWLHIVDLYKDHCSGLYKLCNKITRQHVDITSFGAMRVRLAAQVLSSTVANALELMYDNRVQETVKFVRHVDKFFDCMNCRNLGEAQRKRNDNLRPFTSCDDPRLTFLMDDFLGFFEEWRLGVENRDGDFTAAQRNRMMLSYQTLEGFEITVKSVVSLIRYCLLRGMDFVLTEKFNQDPIEQHFGIHRASHGCNSNPNLNEFNNSMIKIRTVGSQAIAPFRGNTKRRLQLPPINNTPIPKKKKDQGNT